MPKHRLFPLFPLFLFAYLPVNVFCNAPYSSFVHRGNSSLQKVTSEDPINLQTREECHRCQLNMAATVWQAGRPPLFLSPLALESFWSATGREPALHNIRGLAYCGETPWPWRLHGELCTADRRTSY